MHCPSFANRLMRLLLIVMPLTFAALSVAAGRRVTIAPQFLPGEILRYQIESSDVTAGQTTAPIANPEGGTQSKQNLHILVRLDTLGAVPGVPGTMRLRATCEKSTAQSQGDALDLKSVDADDRYNSMEGHSLEIVMQANGQLAVAQGSDSVFTDPTVAGALLSWLGRIFYGGVPRGGVSQGEKWKSDRALPALPLSGLTWHTESTYLRNEPCEAGPATTGAGPRATESAGEGECAVLLTRFEISRSGSSKSDATPDEYRRNGLRTSGKWSGSGQSLDSISLAHGLLVKSTQTSSQDLDYRITSASTGSAIHHKGRIESRSEITLLPDSPTAP
jgi:hypothetical protein